MELRFKSLNKDKQKQLESIRKNINNIILTYHTVDRNKYKIDKKELLYNIHNGKILSYQKNKDGRKNEVLKIGSRKYYHIEGIRVNLIIVLDITENVIITAYFRDTKYHTYNVGKNI